MSIDILIHKNSYTKIQSALTYGFIKLCDSHIINCHNRIYDLYYVFQPKNILLQIEEYSNEFHTFSHDSSINTNIFLSIENNKINFDTYLQILQQIKNTKIKIIAPDAFIKFLEEKNIPTTNVIEYHNLYNKNIFFNTSSNRNNKILCILSMDSNCLSKIEKYLYPKSKLPIVMVNNPEIKHDQNIGLLFDSDMCEALNTFGSIIDFTESYDAEIKICGIPKYSINDLDNLENIKPELLTIETVEVEQFIQEKLLRN